MEHDLKAMYWVRGRLIIAIANATKAKADPEVLKILWKARDMKENTLTQGNEWNFAIISIQKERLR